jgi:hypothetical protein
MFDRISIRYKLIVLLGLSAALALLISSAITIYSTYLSESRSSLRVLHQLTDVISENMRAALAFADAGSANTMLASLRADPHILLAVVNDESGRALAEYRSAGCRRRRSRGSGPRCRAGSLRVPKRCGGKTVSLSTSTTISWPWCARCSLTASPSACWWWCRIRS